MNVEHQQLLLRDLDAPLPAIREASHFRPDPVGHLFSVRRALGLAQAHVAVKLGIKRQAYANFEAGEVRGSISLATLLRAAGAMDCELVYFLVPRSDRARSFTELATRIDPARAAAAAHPHAASIPDGDQPPEAGW